MTTRQPSEAIVIEQTFTAPVAALWQALTDEAQMKQWYFEVMESFKPEVGFQTQFNIHHSGKDYLHIWKVTDVVSQKKIAVQWTFAGYPGVSLVRFDVSPASGGSKVTLTQTGTESFPQDNPDFARASWMQGWTFLIGERLKAFLEKPATPMS